MHPRTNNNGYNCLSLLVATQFVIRNGCILFNAVVELQSGGNSALGFGSPYFSKFFCRKCLELFFGNLQLYYAFLFKYFVQGMTRYTQF